MLPESAETTRSRSQRLFPYFLLAITVAALIPALESAILAPISDDGYLNLNLALQSTWKSFYAQWKVLAHPPVYPLALRLPVCFGHSKLAYLSASLIPGAASVYCLGLIAARLCRNKAVALLAAAAYGFSATMREIIIDVRSYPLALFFMLAAFYCLVATLAGNARRSRLFVCFGIFVSLAIASEYYAVFFLLACIVCLALLWAANPELRERCARRSRRDRLVAFFAFGLPCLVMACLYLAHLRHNLRSFEHLPEFYWSPGISRVDFVLGNLRSDFNYMLPVEIPSAGGALGMLVVLVPLLLYRALCRKPSGGPRAAGVPGLLFLLLLAELVLLSLLRLYPFGGYARQQSILFPFFTLTGFLLLDWIVGRLPATGRFRWLGAGILGLTAAAICVNYSTRGVPGQGRRSFLAAPAGAPEGQAVRPARTRAGKAGIRWVRIPGGTFLMGADDRGPSARPRHEVKIPSFEMARTLVTNKQYRACVAAGACAKAVSLGPWFEGDSQPAIGITWEQARAFSRWAGGRLPTEAEWEYAARSGGREQEYPWGDGDATCERAVTGDCAEYEATAPVCSKPKGNTKQGLCDMAGNTWQWVQDWYHESYQGAPSDGSAWESPAGLARVVRGGTWFFNAGRARSADRLNDDPGVHLYGGFRPAR